MAKFSSIFLPTIVGLAVYIVINKFFPEKVSGINSQKDLRGGDSSKNNLIKKLIKDILNDKALKLALLSVFTTAGIQFFNQEIETLLKDKVFEQLCVKEVDGKLKIVCDIVKEHELNLHSKSIKQLIIANNLSREEKVNLLKIKLDFIINGECTGKTRFLIISIIAALITVCVSGVGGLVLFLEALYRLFQEGKISRALYEQIFKIVTKRVTKVPVEPIL
jgi:hypothetical protein